MTELKWEKLPEAFNNVATGAPEPVFNSFLRTPIKSFDAAMSDFVDRSLDDFGEMGDLGMLGGGSDPNDYEKAAYQLLPALIQFQVNVLLFFDSQLSL